MTSEMGTRLQLAAVGPQDLYITSTNGVSPWTTVFKRPTPFAIDLVETPFANAFVLGRRNRTDVPMGGDCLGAITLEIRLPPIPGALPGDTWVPSVGYALLRRVRVWLNDTLLSDTERLWYDLHDRLFETKDAEAMVGKETPLSLTEPHILHVPLKLPWHRGNWFPLVAAFGGRMMLDIEAEAFAACIRPAPRVDGSSHIRRATYLTPTLVRVSLAPAAAPRTLTLLSASGALLATRTVIPGTDGLTVSLAGPWQAAEARCDGAVVPVAAETLEFPGRPEELDVRCLFEVAFLDSPERFGMRRARALVHCDAAVDMEAATYKEVVDADGRVSRVGLASARIDLSELNFPVRALVWVVYDAAFQNMFEYYTDALDTCRVFANNQEIVRPQPGSYFQLLTKHARGRVAPARDGVHFLPFCLDLGNLQPSGSLAFDKAKQPFLDVALADAFRTAAPKAMVKVFAVVRRLLVVYHGAAAFLTV
jgi:Major capsid protein N-terminus